MAQKKLRINRTIRRIFKPTVGKLLGILMAAYFIFTFISILGRNEVNYYEVEEGSLVKEHDYTGLVIRKEEIVNSDASGYIYFYVADGRKTAAGEPVYLIDAGGDLSSYLSSHSDEITDVNSSKIKDIRTEILHDSRSFSDSSFSMLYDIYDGLEAKAVEYSSLSIFNTISDDLKAAGISFQEFPAGKNGTVCYYTDGYEDITENDLSAELFDSAGYERNTIKAGDLVEAGSPAYKLITDENWYIAFMIAADEEQDFTDSSMLTISFPDKGFITKVPFRIVYGTDGAEYGLISMNSYLVQFTSDRFISFDIVTNDVSGLKIPDKAITTKDFYVIPSEYMTTDAAGNTGFNKAVVGDIGTSYQFVVTDIYSKDDDYCYIECDDNSFLKPGDYVVLPSGAKQSDSQSETQSEGMSETLTSDEASASDDTGDESASDSGEGAAADRNMQAEANANEASADTQDEDAASNRRMHDNVNSDEDIAAGSDTGAGMGENSDDEPSGGMSDEESDIEESRAEMAMSGDDTVLSDITENTSSDTNDTETEDTDIDSGTAETSAQADTSASVQPIAQQGNGGLYQIGAKMPLKGVYNINKGYTVFRKVDVLESANGYSIVKKNTSYGLSTYDHIVLDASQVGDGELIYR